MITIKQINNAIKHLGDITLHKGESYFYFVGNDVKHDFEGVYVDKINQLSLSQWIKEAEQRCDKHKINELLKVQYESILFGKMGNIYYD